VEKGVCDLAGLRTESQLKDTLKRRGHQLAEVLSFHRGRTLADFSLNIDSLPKLRPKSERTPDFRLIAERGAAE
jgi:hypothetical protein